MPGSFDYKANYDTAPIGTVIQSPINLETVTNGKYIALDGRDCIRSQFPEIQSMFPAGVFTSTARTLAKAPSAASICSNGTYFVASGDTSGAGYGIQHSTDGASWTFKDTAIGAANSVNSLIYAGSRFILAAGTAGQPGVAADPTGVWTITTGGTTTTLTQGLAYGSTANAGAGRTVLCKDGALATASGLFYMNDGATAWNACSGGSTRTRLGVCWTGQKFITLCSDADSQIQTSTDGATWADGTIPQPLGGSFYPNKIVSDGNGTVVISVYNGAAAVWFVVSKDHGSTWRNINAPAEAQISFRTGLTGVYSYSLAYLNGKFFGMNAGLGYSIISADGISWQVEPFEMGRGATCKSGAMAYKAGTYCGIDSGTTAAGTFTEDMSKFRLAQSRGMQTVGTNSLHNEYIKVRSN